ncbi:MAG: wax ester/triacylglycerol synthase domain-containing protein [Actinomycetota bacterium]
MSTTDRTASGEASGTPLRSHDAAFLRRSTPDAPMNVGGFITFEPSPRPLTLERVRELVGARLDLLPRFRQRIVVVDDAPQWVDHDRFDIDAHIDEAPLDRSDRGLHRFLATLHATELDAHRPLWSLTLVPASATAGPALFFRASHVLVDGLSSMHVMRSLFDPIGRTDGTTTRSTEPDDAEADEVGVADVLSDLWSTLRPGRPATLDPDAYDRAITLLDGWVSILDRSQHGMPRFAGSGPVRQRVGLAELPSAPLRRLRRDLDLRFDELCLTIVGGALARRFGATDPVEPEARIRTLVPVAGAARRSRSSLGNRASFLLIALPIGPMPIDRRLAIVREEIGEAVASGQHRAAAFGLRALERLPVDPSGRQADAMADRRFVDLVVSCIPGSRRRLRFDGHDHDVTFPLLPVTRTVRVAIGIGDIGGRLGVSIAADDRALPEIDFVLDAMTRATGDLLAAHGTTAS